MNIFNIRPNLKPIMWNPYHIVDPSPWPIATSIGAFAILIGLVGWFHDIFSGIICLCCGFVILFLSLFGWWRDVIREGTFVGKHTLKVQNGLKLGFILFVLSEVMFFLSFFWSFFHFSLSPSEVFGCIWPPQGIQLIDFF